MTPCSAPVSFLRLERLVLGELQEPIDRTVREHVASCPFCGAHLERIRTDAWRLDPLPEPAWRPAWGYAVGALAAAMALFLVALPREPAEDAIKGGGLAMTLVRERNGDVVRDPTAYEDGDRFEVRVTCPPGRADVQLAIDQEGETSFPLGERTAITCGNDVLLGVFTLSGPGDAEVCVTLRDDRSCALLVDGR